MPAKVLIVDDEPSILATMAPLLRSGGYDVLTATSGRAAVESVERDKPDLIVLDLGLPDVDGFEVCRIVREHSMTPIVVLSARGAEGDKVRALDTGADDYVTKPFGAEELTARIRAILRRADASDNAGQPTVLALGALTMWPERRRAEWDGRNLELTSSEYNLLFVLARNAGRPVSKGDLSQQGLGRPLARFDRSIDVHLSSIRHKLGTLPDGRSCIQTVHRLGYQFIKE